MGLSSLMADAVVVLHGAYVAFVLFGLIAVLVGYLLDWNWVHNIWFRCVHLAMILIVAFESLMGIVCPLTTLENYLRRRSGQTVRSGTFVGQLVHDMLFYQAPPWLFTFGYCAFAVIVMATFVLVPPRRNRKSV